MSPFGSHLWVSIAISTPVWLLISVILLSSKRLNSTIGGRGFLDIMPRLPISRARSALFGLVFGVSHGLITGFAITYLQWNSVLGTIGSSILATEVLIGVGIASYVLNNLSFPRVNTLHLPAIIKNVFVFGFVIAEWYAVLSLVLSAPSLIIGVANKPFVNFN